MGQSFRKAHHVGSDPHPPPTLPATAEEGSQAAQRFVRFFALIMMAAAGIKVAPYVGESCWCAVPGLARQGMLASAIAPRSLSSPAGGKGLGSMNQTPGPGLSSSREGVSAQHHPPCAPPPLTAAAASSVGHTVGLLEASEPFLIKSGISRMLLLVRASDSGRERALAAGAVPRLVRLVNHEDAGG